MFAASATEGNISVLRTNFSAEERKYTCIWLWTKVDNGEYQSAVEQVRFLATS
jgi:hypothetical protein